MHMIRHLNLKYLSLKIREEVRKESKDHRPNSKSKSKSWYKSMKCHYCIRTRHTYYLFSLKKENKGKKSKQKQRNRDGDNDDDYCHTLNFIPP